MIDEYCQDALGEQIIPCKAETIIGMLCPGSIIIIPAIISFFIRNVLVLQSPSEIFQRILYSAEMLSCKMCKWGWNKALEFGQGDWDGISRPKKILNQNVMHELRYIWWVCMPLLYARDHYKPFEVIKKLLPRCSSLYFENEINLVDTVDEELSKILLEK